MDKGICGIKLKPHKSTKIQEKLWFMDLPQIDRWKQRSCTKRHVFGVRFGFGSL
jgi:hypothetical protein